MRLDQPVGAGAMEGRRRHVQRRDIDWAAVQRDYWHGELSLRQLADRHGCSHSAIANRATAEGWQRKSHCARLEQ